MNQQNAIMRHSWGISLVALTAALAAVGCADGAEQSSEPLSDGQPLEPLSENHLIAPENSGTSEKDCGPLRPDWATGGYDAVTGAQGDFGAFGGCIDWCPVGSYVYGVQLKSEAAQGAGDDTAVNAIRLMCYDRWTGAWTRSLHSGFGSWGTWGTAPVASTVDKPVVGTKFKFQPAAGTSIDDAQVTSATFKLKDNSWLLPSPSNVTWGSWLASDQCQPGNAVCGMLTQVEPYQGAGEDDTALTGAEFWCCSFPN
jgi:hypothetical protein